MKVITAIMEYLQMDYWWKVSVCAIATIKSMFILHL